MVADTQVELKERIKAVTGRVIMEPVELFEDTSSYAAIVAGSVLRLDGADYLVTGSPRDSRFGFDDQPMVWTKYAVDLSDGARKIIKLVFYEQFSFAVKGINIHLRRDPQKEGAFLEEVRGDSHFMQGQAVTDPAGNLVRIVDRLPGQSLFERLARMNMPHEDYFDRAFPEVMGELIESIEALALVHQRGLQHGDIRSDHLLFSDSGRLVWIDFDFATEFEDYDLWCLGGVLASVVGGGPHNLHGIKRRRAAYPRMQTAPGPQDTLFLHPYQVANLRKLFPYVPRRLNRILMSFSRHPTEMYEDIHALAADLRGACL